MVKTIARWASAVASIFVSHGWAATTPAAPTPRVSSDLFAGPGLGQMILGLATVLIFIFVLAWAARRLGPVKSLPTGALRVLGGLSLGTRERLVLVKVGDAQLLLGVAPGRVQTLHVLAEPIEVAGPPDTKASAREFAERLQSALHRGQS
ncbi:MAG: flagellar biosynthetic protein FliO [Porticoccaceae bacterium]